MLVKELEIVLVSYTSDRNSELFIKKSFIAKVQLNIPEDCRDNPNFAKCADVIRRNYCDHVYYSKFCCRSCALAKQV